MRYERQTASRWVPIALYTALLCCGSNTALGATPSTSSDDVLFAYIAHCLRDGKEVVMAPQYDCVARGSGGSIARRAGMPFGVANATDLCKDANDPRRLPGDIVRRLARQPGAAIAPSGIRIVGAVFCDEVDIVGLDLPHSLVLDRSLFNARVFARNIKIRGDLSIDSSYLPSSLVLTRSRIEGSVYAQDSFINRVVVFDTHVQGSWHQTVSVIFKDAEFHGLTLSGSMDLSKSALTHLRVQSVQARGGLVLNHSQARCTYHIKGSEFGYVSADDVGFGGTRTVAAEAPADPVAAAAARGPNHAWWSQVHLNRKEGNYLTIGQKLASPAAVTFVAAEREQISKKPTTPLCQSATANGFAEFYFLENKVQNTFCLRSFTWMSSDTSAPATTILAMNGTTVGSSLIMDLWPGTVATDNSNETRKFEAIGLSTGALIFDFSDNERRYSSYLDGWSFKRVHNAKLGCTYRAASVDYSEPSADQKSGYRGAKVELPLPSVQQVMRWLERNEAPSSQPIAAFVEAFESAGADATDLRVARKTKELCERTKRWWPSVPWCDGSTSTSRPAGPSRIGDSVAPVTADLSLVGIAATTADAIIVVLQSALWIVADHGLRPEKVIWWVVIVLFAFWLYFWFRLDVVGFEPKAPDGDSAVGNGKPQPASGTNAPSPPKLWPVSFLFLFDRLVPAYRIRDEHYAIGKLYRRATAGEVAGVPAGGIGPPFAMKYLGKTHRVSPTDEDQMQRVEKLLVVLRIIGVGLSLFLIAAVNALVSQS
jgi:hypothetical protein